MPSNSSFTSAFTRRGLIVAGAAAAAAAPSRVWAQPYCHLGGRTLSVGAPNGLAIGLQSYPRTLALAPGEVVLTLDDGPLPGQTDRVLDALRLYGAPATFFLIGRNAAANPHLVRRMAAEGHTVAHHTLTHPWTLRQRSFEAGVRDIEDGIRAVQTAQGIAGSTVATPFFRYPGFADTERLNDWLAMKGMVTFGSDLWGSDWTPMSPERQLSLLMGRLKRAGRGIILLHDVVGQTASMFPAFLQALCAGGYKVVGLTPGPFAPQTIEAGAGWRSYTNRIIAGRG
ncbi:MAG: polysaccharide deacetylase family protein [Hyphomicrobiales bacterium]|nr:polysaccharide deacetylase family protein [Hyphomicrobiales bacterium]